MILEACLVQDFLLLAECQHIGVDTSLAQIGGGSIAVFVWSRQLEFSYWFACGGGLWLSYRLERRTDTALDAVDLSHSLHKGHALNFDEIVHCRASGGVRLEVGPRPVLGKGQ